MILDTIEREFSRDLAGLASQWPALPGTLTDVLDHIRRDPDPALAELLGALAAGEALAGRVVLCSFVPKLRLLARDGLDEGALVGAFWEVIAAYPLARRRTRIAANLVLDCRKRALADLPREVPAGLWPGEVASPAEPDDVRAAHVLARAAQLRLVTDSTVRVLDDVYCRGLPGRDAARLHGLSEPALRKRCSKAVARLAAERARLLADPVAA